MSYEQRKKQMNDRFERDNLNEDKIRKAKTLDEINEAMNSEYSNLKSAERNKDIMLQGIDEYGKDVIIHHRDIQFSDSTEAHLTEITIDYKKSKDSADDRAKILSDIKKEVINGKISDKSDIRYHFSVKYKNIKQKTGIGEKNNTGIVTTKFPSIDIMIGDILTGITDILDEYEDEVEGIDIEFTEF